jgi:anti-sigma B factor antagonist
MQQGHLKVRGRLDDDRARLVLEGEVDLASAQTVRRAVGDVLDQGAREIVIDLTPVTFLDSTGLALLLHAARDADRRGAAVRSISPAGAEARLVIELAGVGGILGLEDPQPAQPRP